MSPAPVPVPARAPGRPRDDQVDAAVLRATVELLADTGFGALTIEAVAVRTGVAKSTIYRRWSNKEELAFHALADLKGPVPQPPGVSVRGDLLFMLQAMRRQWTDGLHGRLMRQLSADGSRDGSLYRSFRERLIAPRQAALLGLVDRGVREGIIDPGADRDWVLQMLVGPIIAAGMTHQTTISAEQITFTVGTVLRGIAPRP